MINNKIHGKSISQSEKTLSLWSITKYMVNETLSVQKNSVIMINNKTHGKSISQCKKTKWLRSITKYIINDVSVFNLPLSNFSDKFYWERVLILIFFFNVFKVLEKFSEETGHWELTDCRKKTTEISFNHFKAASQWLENAFSVPQHQCINKQKVKSILWNTRYWGTAQWICMNMYYQY